MFLFHYPISFIVAYDSNEISGYFLLNFLVYTFLVNIIVLTVVFLGGKAPCSGGRDVTGRSPVIGNKHS